MIAGRSFSREFGTDTTQAMILIGIAFLIASPITYFFMRGWLQDFTYRISMSWWMFVLAGVLALVIALATISFQAIRAAIANPVKSLRTE